MKIHIRFWDKKNNQMLYGLGITEKQQPVRQNTDGSLTVLEGAYVPMLSTLTPDAKGNVIWQSDVCQADMQVLVMTDMPPSMMKVIGVMQYDIPTGTFTLIVHDAPASMAGRKFQLSNITVIGNAFENGDLLLKQQGETVSVAL